LPILALRRVDALAGVDRAHPLATGVEGQLVEARVRVRECLLIDATLDGQHPQGGLGLIAE
jgi:hypothetical protein